MGLNNVTKAIWQLLQGTTNPNVTSIWTLLQNMSVNVNGIAPGGVAYYVEGVNGLDTNDGLSWAKAVKTIQKAIDLNNATVDWGATPKKWNVIYVAPAHDYGEYDENLTFPYYCYIVGLGIRGTDTMVAVSPALGSAFHGTMLGCALINLKLAVKEAGNSVLDIGICNSSLIKDCMFSVDATVANTIGIDTETSTHLEVAHCSFESGFQNFAYGMYFRGGLNKFLHNARIHDNVIFADNTGIWIQNTCTPSQAVIQHNKIMATTIGIDDNAGASYVIDNFIVSADAIDHAGGITHTIGNRIIQGGAGAWEA